MSYFIKLTDFIVPETLTKIRNHSTISNIYNLVENDDEIIDVDSEIFNKMVLLIGEITNGCKIQMNDSRIIMFFVFLKDSDNIRKHSYAFEYITTQDIPPKQILKKKFSLILSDSDIEEDRLSSLGYDLKIDTVNEIKKRLIEMINEIINRSVIVLNNIYIHFTCFANIDSIYQKGLLHENPQNIKIGDREDNELSDYKKYLKYKTKYLKLKKNLRL